MPGNLWHLDHGPETYIVPPISSVTFSAMVVLSRVKMGTREIGELEQEFWHKLDELASLLRLDRASR